MLYDCGSGFRCALAGGFSELRFVSWRLGGGGDVASDVVALRCLLVMANDLRESRRGVRQLRNWRARDKVLKRGCARPSKLHSKEGKRLSVMNTFDDLNGCICTNVKLKQCSTLKVVVTTLQMHVKARCQ